MCVGCLSHGCVLLVVVAVICCCCCRCVMCPCSSQVSTVEDLSTFQPVLTCGRVLAMILDTTKGAPSQGAMPATRTEGGAPLFAGVTVGGALPAENHATVCNFVANFTETWPQCH